ncbi:hypothetical protein HQ529_01120 [Candidatus Woesearchaeota archaeon]|nr:hypothetical protein [Candidatus Woesearchaeota archaeon]
MKNYIGKKAEEQRIQQQKRDNQREKQSEEAKAGKKKKIAIISTIVVVVLLIFVYFIYSSYTKPGILDDFSKCMTEKGVVMYGADWCQYTSSQKAMFGNSFKHLNYKDISEKGDLNIKITPTWVIDGELYEKVRGFNELASLTGCELPKP